MLRQHAVAAAEEVLVPAADLQKEVGVALKIYGTYNKSTGEHWEKKVITLLKQAGVQIRHVDNDDYYVL